MLKENNLKIFTKIIYLFYIKNVQSTHAFIMDNTFCSELVHDIHSFRSLLFYFCFEKPKIS